MKDLDSPDALSAARQRAGRHRAAMEEERMVFIGWKAKREWGGRVKSGMPLNKRAGSVKNPAQMRIKLAFELELQSEVDRDQLRGVQTREGLSSSSNICIDV